MIHKKSIYVDLTPILSFIRTQKVFFVSKKVIFIHDLNKNFHIKLYQLTELGINDVNMLKNDIEMVYDWMQAHENRKGETEHENSKLSCYSNDCVLRRY